MGTMGYITLITFIAKYVVSMLSVSLRVAMYLGHSIPNQQGKNPDVFKLSSNLHH